MKYIPRPVIVGFTNGIAVLIASTQIKDFLGLKIEKVPGEFIGRIEALATHVNYDLLVRRHAGGGGDCC